AEVIAWWEVNPRVWISESAQVRETIYPKETALSYDYIYQHTPMIELRLKQAGVRLAAYLNDLFSEPLAGAKK
ncbi:MAG: S1/P1 Nuclease, partial [Pseudomonadota bacterium]|nr:S1/P1 Nuclease [Pseudomonadota bacterium]